MNLPTDNGQPMYIPQNEPLNGPLSLNELMNKYSYEVVGFTLVLIYIIMYVAGNKKNNIVIWQYYEKCQEFYENNFAHIGVGTVSGQNIFHQESSNQFKFFASGRVNCKFTQLQFDLEKRQDLISNYLFGMLWPERDQVKFDIPISTTPLPLCFALLKKKDAPTYKENNMDIKYLTQKVNVNNLDSIFICLGEDTDIMNTIFDQRTVNLLNRCQKQIQEIHLTDQQTFGTSPFHLRVVLNLTANQADSLELTQMVFHLLDRIANLKIPHQIRQKCEKERHQFQELKLKDEKLKRMEVQNILQYQELQKKKMEKKQKEQQKLLTMSREKQLQLQEREKKEEIRKRMAKRVMRV